eukprot:1233375-Amphidinium_carterae.1
MTRGQLTDGWVDMLSSVLHFRQYAASVYGAIAVSSLESFGVAQAALAGVADGAMVEVRHVFLMYDSSHGGFNQACCQWQG